MQLHIIQVIRTVKLGQLFLPGVITCYNFDPLHCLNLSPNSMDQEGKNFIDISHENLVLDCQKGIVISVYNNFNY